MEIHSRTNAVRPRVGLLYDERMCEHAKPPEDTEHHPEIPNRIKAIWSRLESANIPQRCLVMKTKEAEDKYIGLVHEQKYIDLIKSLRSKSDSQRKVIAEDFNSIYFNEGSSQSAYLAAGGVIEVAEKVAKGKLDSAVAIVRPPGHHAEADEALGFCIFNNVAIAANVLVNEKPELGIKKILIVDWDVHHGNGTQNMFWEDPRVLVFNVHRHDFGEFFPAGDDGSHVMIGEGSGTGYNVNVPWEQGECGDADYFAVWDHVLIPITKAFNPDIILISAGFDAAAGDTLGGCFVTPNGYSVMLKKLMAFASGRIVMALEGGYHLKSLSKSVLACVEALLEDRPITGSSKSDASPLESTWRVIESVRKELSKYWPMLSGELPNTTQSQRISLIEELQSANQFTTDTHATPPSVKVCNSITISTSQAAPLCKETDKPNTFTNLQIKRKSISFTEIKTLEMDGSEDVESSGGDRAWKILSQKLWDSENSVKALKEDLRKEQEKVKWLEKSNFDLKTEKEISLKEVESLKKESAIYIEQAKRMKKQICSQNHVINQHNDKMMQLKENNSAQQLLLSFICSALEMRITAEQQRCNILEKKLLFADKQVASDMPTTTPAGVVCTYISTPQAILLEKQLQFETVEVLVPVGILMSTMSSKYVRSPSTKRKCISDCEEMTPEKKRCKTSNNENLITVLVEDLKREQEKVLNLGKSVAAESSLKDLALKEVELLKVESGNYTRDVVNLQNQISKLKGVINQTEAEVSKLKIEIVNSQKEQKLVSSLKKQNLSEQKKCKELEQKCSLTEEIFDEYQSDCLRFQSRMETVFRKDETTEQKERTVKKVLKGVRLRLDNKRGKTRRKRKCMQRRKPEDKNMVEE
ncbi:hypothetical protein C5167_005803 [Papaver somniferum]|uniref:histone deacetylase n=1 Tax=Papaver somniferum TaxID=3469 RepID=A0A4Y7JEM9_PAPSO|nr:histone deacetylase 18-like [Papaver somniferum]RZC58502.1 hypothetical protein C5167_005803 [Papaver somniferum]